MPALPNPESHPGGNQGGVGEESRKRVARCRKHHRGAEKEVSLLSLTPRMDRIRQGIKAGKQRIRKFTLIWILLGDAQEPAGRKERFRVAFPWLHVNAELRISPAERGAGTCLWQAAAARDKEALGKTKLRQALGRQIHIRVALLMAEIRKFNSCSYLRSFRISSIEDLYLQRCCSEFSHARHSYKPY